LKKTAFQNGNLVATGVSGVVFGAYYGILLQAFYFNGMDRYIQPSERTFLKLAARILVTAAVAGPILLLYLFVEIPNLYVQMFVKDLLPMTLATLLVFGVSDEVCLKLGLYDTPVLSEREA
jgi:hypothetical protein